MTVVCAWVVHGGLKNSIYGLLMLTSTGLRARRSRTTFGMTRAGDKCDKMTKL